MLRAFAAGGCAVLVSAGPLSSQAVLPDTARRVLELHALIEKHGRQIGPLIWPGFRPDTIPTLYVIAHRGKLLVQWRHGWPEGFAPSPDRPDVGLAGSGTVSLPRDKFISFMSVDSSMSAGSVLGTSIHEAFHSYERSVMREGQTFGGWENAMLVGTYPVFDVENEAAVAREGRKLRQALEGPSREAVQRYAREFLALREARQRVLDSEFTEFEKLAELNEGLAQYALVRGLREVARLEGGAWEAAARREAAIESGLLDSLLQLGQRSVRRRFYAMGSAMALVLDRLAGDAWKDRLLRENLNLQEALAVVTGYDARAESPPVDQAAIARATREAEHSIRRLRAERVAQADRASRAQGIQLSIDSRPLGRSGLQWCGFDPQNTLQTGDGRTLHTRFLRVCAPAAKAEFDRPVVQDDTTRVLAVSVPASSITLTSRGAPAALVEGTPAELIDLVLTGDDVRLEAKRARVTRRGATLEVQLLE